MNEYNRSLDIPNRRSKNSPLAPKIVIVLGLVLVRALTVAAEKAFASLPKRARNLPVAPPA